MDLNKIKSAKNKLIASVLAGSLLVGGKTLLKDNKQYDSPIMEDAKVIEESISKPFNTYGEFKDASDINQVLARAASFYQTYILDENKSPRIAEAVSIEDIMDTIRLVNGEFILDENLEPTYSEDDLIKVANILATISNCDSLPEYGRNIFYTPLAPLFVDGSYAQKKAMNIDETMKKVVKTIRENNRKEFESAAKEWYMSYINLVGNINDARLGPSAFFLFSGYYSKYVSSIYEYANNEKIEIIIADKKLSTTMENLNSNIINKNGQSLPEELYSISNDYYDDRYKKQSEVIHL